MATEFAIVKVRMSKIDQMIAEGKTGAQAAKKVVSNLDEYLSACQLGITVTALGLGWLGEPTVARMLRPVFIAFDLNESVAQVLSFGVAFAIVTFLHVVIGELAPKTVAIQKAERITLLFAVPMIWFYRVMFPFIWFLNGTARLLVKMFGLKPASEHDVAHSEEELRILLSESYKSGEINQTELNYVNNIFEFDERTAKEIMVPRTEIISISADATLEEVIKTVQEGSFTRYPVIREDKDDVIGFINARELLTAVVANGSNGRRMQLKDFINPIIQVIESIPVNDLLLKMQKERVHIAILIDEYGGTSGLVTVEDILEEIVGDIRDEFDEDEVPEVRKIKDDHFILDSKVLLEEVNQLLEIELIDEEVDTIGGWFLKQKFDAEIGSMIDFEGYTFKVREKDGHHIRYVEVKKTVQEVRGQEVKEELVREGV